MTIERFNEIKESLELLGYVEMDDEEYMEYLEMGGGECMGLDLSKMEEINILEKAVGKFN